MRKGWNQGGVPSSACRILLGCTWGLSGAEGSAMLSTQQPVTAGPVFVTSSRVSASVHHAPSPLTAWSASHRALAATPWLAVRSVTAQGPESRN